MFDWCDVFGKVVGSSRVLKIFQIKHFKELIFEKYFIDDHGETKTKNSSEKILIRIWENFGKLFFFLKSLKEVKNKFVPFSTVSARQFVQPFNLKNNNLRSFF